MKKLPCPFCGESEKLCVAGGGASSRWHVVCEGCWVNGPAAFTEQHYSPREDEKRPGENFRKHPAYTEAIEAWNKRTRAGRRGP